MAKVDRSGFPDKFKKLLPENFQEDVEAKETKDIKEEILKAESIINNTEKEKDEDANLKAAKERVADLASAYGDVLKCQKAKIKYCFYVLNSRGAD